MSLKNPDGVLHICTPPSSKGSSRIIAKTPGRSSSRQSTNISTPRRQSHRKTPADRFIPSRSGANPDFSSHSLLKSVSNSSTSRNRDTCDDDSVAGSLLDQLLQEGGCKTVLNFTPVKSKNRNYWESHPPNTSSPALSHQCKTKKRRKIPKSAEKILDAPNLINDFYMDVLDWSSQNNLAVALGSTVYVYSVLSGAISELCRAEDRTVHQTALQWSLDGACMAVGYSDGEVQLWDHSTGKLVRRMRSHYSRVGCMSWNPQSSGTLSSGSQMGDIHHYDVRVPQFHTHSMNRSHLLDVCGLEWSHNGRLLASGGNDNIVNVWENDSRTTPLHSLREHSAAVKALSWCPWKANILATGGGTADKKINLWNTSSGFCQAHIQTDSQVCCLLWSLKHHELISGHGYAQNHVTIWEYPSLSPITHLYGHEDRILHMGMSPSGDTVVTAAADETLRFWRCSDVPTRHQVTGSSQIMSDLELKMLSLAF